MLQKIKILLRKLLGIRSIKSTVIFLLANILPRTFFLRLKKWLAYTIYKDSQPKFSLTNDEQAPEDLFRLITFNNQQKKVDLLICCAFKGRHELLEKSIEESLFLKNDYRIEWFLCGSTKEDHNFIQTMAIKTNKVSGIIWRNKPLGEKWHFCIKTAGNLFDANLYAIIGSDDMFSTRLIQSILEKHQDKLSNKAPHQKLPAMYCTDKWVIIRKLSEDYFPSAVSCAIKHSDYYVPLGAGRFYTKEFLQEANFNIFDMTRNSCLDDFGYFKSIQLGYTIERYEPEEGLLISLKGSWEQMNAFEAIIKADTIEIEDYTFSILDKLKKDLSSEMNAYLFKANMPNQTYAWTMDTLVE